MCSPIIDNKRAAVDLIAIRSVERAFYNGKKYQKTCQLYQEVKWSIRKIEEIEQNITCSGHH